MNETVKNRELREKIAQDYEWGFVSDVEQEFAPKGLSEDTVRFISAKKNEPEWMLDWRLKAFHAWLAMEEVSWAKLDIPPIAYQDAYYYAAPKAKPKLQSLDELDPDPPPDRRPHQVKAGVGDSRHASLRDERDVALAEALEEEADARPLVVLVVAHQRLVNVKVVEEPAGRAGVLGRDERHLAHNPKGAEGDVFKIADWRPDEIEDAHRLNPARTGHARRL